MALNPMADPFNMSRNQNFRAVEGSVASDRNGNYVIVWSSINRDGSDSGIFGQRFRADGTRIGGEFRVNTTTQGNQRSPSVGMDSDGNFVVTWLSDNPSPDIPLGKDVYAQRFRADGSRIDSEFRVNEQDGLITSNLLEIAVADNGNFTIVWQQRASASNGVTDIYARSFTPAIAGITARREYLVNQITGDFQVRPDVAVDRFGNAAITWESGGGFSSSNGPDGDKSAIAGRLFSLTGTARSDEFVINQTTVGRQTSPSIAMTASGKFVVTWVDNLSRGEPGDPYRLMARQFNASANPTSQEIIVESTLGGAQTSKVAIDDAGNFVVAWAGDRIAGSRGVDFDTLARRYLANGTPDTNAFEVPTVDTQYDGISEITSDPDGDIVIVWSDLARQYSPRSVNRGGGNNSGRGGGNSGNNGPIVGTSETNVLRGTSAADVIRGRGGDDRLIGRGNNDRLIGGAGDDFLNGGGGNDTIRGGSGNDIIRGGSGNDKMNGGGGNDILDGGTGDNILKGQGGRDTFVLRRGNGVTRIQGFKRQDTFQLKGMRARDLTIEQMGNGVSISRGNDEITFVQGVNLGQLPSDIFGASNFV